MQQIYYFSNYGHLHPPILAATTQRQDTPFRQFAKPTGAATKYVCFIFCQDFGAYPVLPWRGACSVSPWRDRGRTSCMPSFHPPWLGLSVALSPQPGIREGRVNRLGWFIFRSEDQAKNEYPQGYNSKGRRAPMRGETPEPDWKLLRRFQTPASHELQPQRQRFVGLSKCQQKGRPRSTPKPRVASSHHQGSYAIHLLRRPRRHPGSGQLGQHLS
jgi:hypothetical protein